MRKSELKYVDAVLSAYDGLSEGISSGFCQRVYSSDFIRKVGQTFATRVLLVGIGMVTSVIVARILGPEGRGLYSVAMTVGALGVQFGNLGLHASNTYFVANDRGLLPALAANSVVVSGTLGGAGAALLWMIFRIWPDTAPVAGSLLILSLLWIPFGLAYMLFQNLLLGIQEVRAYNQIELVTKAFGLGLIGVLILTEWVSVRTLLLATLIVVILGFAWAFLRLRPLILSSFVPSLALFKDTLHYGSKAYLAVLFAFLVLRINVLMVKYILDAEEAGYYSIATTMADMVYMLPVVVGTVLFPKLSAMTDARVKWAYTKRVALSVGVITVVLSAGAALLAGPLVQLLFGEAFVPSVPAFIWMLPGVVFLSINTCYMNYFASVGMPLVTVVSPGLAAILAIVANVKLIPWLGIVGASVTSVLSYGLMLAASIIYVSYFEERQP